MENFEFKSASDSKSVLIHDQEELNQQPRSRHFPSFEEYVSRVKNHSKGCQCCSHDPKPLESKSDLQSSVEFERNHQQVRF
jgi:hypothetical protein